MLSPTYVFRYLGLARRLPHAKIGTCEIAAKIPPLAACGRASLPLLRNLLRLLALRPVCGAPRFDRNLTAIGCLYLSLCVPLRELEPDKSAVLSPCVPPCLPLSLKENDYESEGRRFESCRARHRNLRATAVS